MGISARNHSQQPKGRVFQQGNQSWTPASDKTQPTVPATSLAKVQAMQLAY